MKWIVFENVWCERDKINSLRVVKRDELNKRLNKKNIY